MTSSVTEQHLAGQELPQGQQQQNATLMNACQTISAYCVYLQFQAQYYLYDWLMNTLVIVMSCGVQLTMQTTTFTRHWSAAASFYPLEESLCDQQTTRATSHVSNYHMRRSTVHKSQQSCTRLCRLILRDETVLAVWRNRDQYGMGCRPCPGSTPGSVRAQIHD